MAFTGTGIEDTDVDVVEPDFYGNIEFDSEDNKWYKKYQRYFNSYNTYGSSQFDAQKSALTDVAWQYFSGQTTRMTPTKTLDYFYEEDAPDYYYYYNINQNGAAADTNEGDAWIAEKFGELEDTYGGDNPSEIPESVVQSIVDATPDSVKRGSGYDDAFFYQKFNQLRKDRNRALNNYNNQRRSNDAWRQFGLPDPSKVWGVQDSASTVAYPGIADWINKQANDYKSKLVKMGYTDEQATNYTEQFTTIVLNGVNQKLSKVAVTPFVYEAAKRKNEGK